MPWRATLMRRWRAAASGLLVFAVGGLSLISPAAAGAAITGTANVPSGPGNPYRVD